MRSVQRLIQLGHVFRLKRRPPTRRDNQVEIRRDSSGFEMKGSSCTLLASVLAASTVAISSTSYSADPQEKQFVSMDKSRSDDSRKQLPLTSSDKEKFRPRFDGMRFIETLVTAHR